MLVFGYDGKLVIVVLLFVYMLDDVSGDYIVDGIMEDIIILFYLYCFVFVIVCILIFGYKNLNKLIF